MAQISKRFLSSKELELIWRRFVDVFAKASDRSTIHAVLKGMLTRTERVMLAKRVVAGFFILSDWDAYAIADVLKLSVSSVYKYIDHIEHDQDYKNVLSRLLPDKIPPPKPEQGTPRTPDLIKLLDNIFECYTRRSKLIYG